MEPHARLAAEPGPVAHEPNRSNSKLKTAGKYALYAIVAVSLAWPVLAIIIEPPGWSQVVSTVRQAALFFVFLIITEVMFIAGMLLVLARLGVSVFAGTGRNPRQWWQAIERQRQNWRQTLDRISRDRLLVLGFYLNWLGAIGTGVVLAIAIMVIFPWQSWGLLIIPAADIVMSMIWRAVVLRKLRDVS